MEELSGLLDFVRVSSGTSFRSCEPEIIELMRQIDIMIEDKAVQWHKQILALDNELQLRTTENEQLTKKLEESQNDVKVLQKQLANEKKNNNKQMTQYDTEIEKLKSELNKFKTKFKKNSTKKLKEDSVIENTKESVVSTTSKIDCHQDVLIENSNLLEKSVCSLSSCLQDTNKTLDRRVNELQLCRLQLESLYFENTILRSFLHQRGIINFLEDEEESITTAFAEKEIKRENELKEKIQSRIDEFMNSTFD